MHKKLNQQMHINLLDPNTISRELIFLQYIPQLQYERDMLVNT